MKLKQKLKIITTGVLSFFLISDYNTPVAAQPIGSPVFTQSRGEFSLSFSGGYFGKEIYSIQNKSPRFILKGLYGIAGFVDLFGEIGFTKLNIVPSHEAKQHFDDKYHLAYGGGLTIRYLNISAMRFSLFISSQFFRFTSNPISEDVKTVANSDIKQVLELQYDWKEIILNTGIIQGVGLLNLFGGVQFRMTHRKETRINKYIISGQVDSENFQTGTYKSGLQIYPFFGIDFTLPSRCTLSVDILARSSSDFNVNLGISQTGKPQ